jgi:hypothetical protein
MIRKFLPKLKAIRRLPIYNRAGLRKIPPDYRIYERWFVAASLEEDYETWKSC